MWFSSLKFRNVSLLALLINVLSHFHWFQMYILYYHPACACSREWQKDGIGIDRDSERERLLWTMESQYRHKSFNALLSSFHSSQYYVEFRPWAISSTLLWFFNSIEIMHLNSALIGIVLNYYLTRCESKLRNIELNQFSYSI